MKRITRMVALAALAAVAFHSQATTSQAATKKQSFSALLNLQQDNFAAKTTNPAVSGVRASYVATAARNGLGSIRASAADPTRAFLRYFTNQFRVLLRAEQVVTNSRLQGIRQLYRAGLLTRDQFDAQRYQIKLNQLEFNAALSTQFALVNTQLAAGIIPPATAIRGGTL